jgi:hypothetical protein
MFRATVTFLPAKRQCAVHAGAWMIGRHRQDTEADTTGGVAASPGAIAAAWMVLAVGRSSHEGQGRDELEG